MKEFKIVLLVLAIGFGSSAPATTTFSNAYYFGTFKGGLQAVHIYKPAKLAVLEVEGNNEYYLQYLKFKLDNKKVGEEQGPKKEIVSPSCSWVPWI